MTSSQKKNKPICINFVAPITGITVNVLSAALADAVKKHHSQVHLLMSSPGGGVADGIAMYNFMRSLPVEITTYNLGAIDSIGNVVFMGGKHRVSAPVSRFMFHGVGFDIQKARFEMKDIRERYRNLSNDHTMISDILVKETDLTAKDVESLLIEAAYLSAQEAYERGIVHEVKEISLPDKMPVIPLVFQS